VQEYPVRTDHRGNLTPEALAQLVEAHFGRAERSGNDVAASYGAITRIAVGASGRALRVDITMNPKVPEDVARDTIARYNRFLEEVTGYTSKERAKRLRKSAGESSSGA
jgi:hypothetical protein